MRFGDLKVGETFTIGGDLYEKVSPRKACMPDGKPFVLPSDTDVEPFAEYEPPCPNCFQHGCHGCDNPPPNARRASRADHRHRFRHR